MMATEEIERELVSLREEYASLNGKPFEHFFCPLLLRDEKTDLCMGHVVNAATSGSCRTRVVQRADVDNFYGSAIEADYCAMREGRVAGLKSVMFDRGMRKKTKPQIFIDGEVVSHYLFSGCQGPGHSGIILEIEPGGDLLHLVLTKNPADVLAAKDKKWNIVVEHDSRASGVVTLIKSAYLTLFRMFGYRYALRASGLCIGRDVLGRFYEENRDKSPVAKVNGIHFIGSEDEVQTC
jgi:hypothetical protein